MKVCNPIFLPFCERNIVCTNSYTCTPSKNLSKSNVLYIFLVDLDCCFSSASGCLTLHKDSESCDDGVAKTTFVRQRTVESSVDRNQVISSAQFRLLMVSCILYIVKDSTSSGVSRGVSGCPETPPAMIFFKLEGLHPNAQGTSPTGYDALRRNS